MQLFKRTPEEAFQNIESFDYKTHYIANLVNIRVNIRILE